MKSTSNIHFETITKDFADPELLEAHLGEISNLMWEFSEGNEPIENILIDIHTLVLQRGYIVILARETESQTAVGYGVLVLADIRHGLAHLAEAYVLPTYREKGIYGRLIEEREKIAEEAGFTRLRALVFPDGEANTVLAKHGYERKYNEHMDGYMVKRMDKLDIFHRSREIE